MTRLRQRVLSSGWRMPKKSVLGYARLHKSVPKAGYRICTVTQKRNQGRFPVTHGNVSRLRSPVTYGYVSWLHNLALGYACYVNLQKNA